MFIKQGYFIKIKGIGILFSQPQNGIKNLDFFLPITPIKIVASTNVWGDIAYQIAGDIAQVDALIYDQNQDPHSFEASARDQLLIENADIVIMNCYAPLFTRVEPNGAGSNWKTDLIGYNSVKSYGSPSYYVQNMFANARGDTVLPEIMVPLVATKRELDILKAAIDKQAQDVFKEQGASIEYMVGTMIELPRAALRAADIAQTASFFSFGTNDLTQTTFGLSRDDSGSFLDAYQGAGILEHDPFVTLDQDGVGELVSIAVERGRKARPDIKLGKIGRAHV